MKKGLLALTLLPSLAAAHLGPAHSHPEELLGGLGLVAVVAVGLWLSLGRKR